MLKKHTALVASLLEIESLKSESDLMNKCVSITLIGMYYEVLWGEGIQDKVLSNLVTGMSDSFGYYLNNKESKYFEQILGYLEDIAKHYRDILDDEKQIFLEDSELIDFYFNNTRPKKGSFHRLVS